MFFSRKHRSGLIAKDRLKLLLVSERIDCTPQMMIMLKNDMVQTVSKYFSVEDKKVKINFSKDPLTLSACIPLQLSCDTFMTNKKTTKY